MPREELKTRGKYKPPLTLVVLGWPKPPERIVKLPHHILDGFGTSLPRRRINEMKSKTKKRGRQDRPLLVTHLRLKPRSELSHQIRSGEVQTESLLSGQMLSDW